MKLLVLILTIVSCASCVENRRGDGPDVKVYISKPDQGGLVRSQESEIVLYSESVNFRCLNKENFDALIKYCYDPENKVVDQLRSKISKVSNRRKRKFLNKIVKEIETMLVDEDFDQKNKILGKMDELQAQEI